MSLTPSGPVCGFGTFRLNPKPQVELDKIPYTDFPELKFSEHESTEMPFRYVKAEDGSPIMPQVRIRIMGLPSERANYVVS